MARLCSYIESKFSYSTALQHIPFNRIFEVERGSLLIYALDVPNPNNVNCAIEFYLQTGSCEDKIERGKLLLFQQISHEPAFDFLRTKEQLGYIVFDGIRKQTGIIGYRIVIQSERDPMYLETRIEGFLAHLDEILSNISQEQFEKHRSSLILKLTEKNKNLSQESGRIWSHIQSGNFEFDQHQQDSETISRLDLKEIQDFYKKYIKKGSMERKKLSVHLCKKGQDYTPFPENKIVTISTLPKEKKSWQLGPSPTPAKPINNFFFKSHF